MILSNPYVIKDVLQDLDKGNIKELKRSCEKFHDRYVDDKEFASVLEMALGKRGDPKDLEEMKMKLGRLLTEREKIFSSVSGSWFKQSGALSAASEENNDSDEELEKGHASSKEIDMGAQGNDELKDPMKYSQVSVNRLYY